METIGRRRTLSLLCETARIRNSNRERSCSRRRVAGKRLFKNSPRTRSVAVSVEVSFPFECDSPFSLSISLSLSLPFSVSLSISPSMNLLGVVSRLSLPLTRRSNSGLVSPPSRRSSSSPAYFHPPECTHAYLEVRGCLSRQIPKPLTDVFRGKHSRPLRATS